MNQQPPSERTLQWFKDFESGRTLASIAAESEVTRQRVHQVLSKHFNIIKEKKPTVAKPATSGKPGRPRKDGPRDIRGALVRESQSSAERRKQREEAAERIKEADNLRNEQQKIFDQAKADFVSVRNPH